MRTPLSEPQQRVLDYIREHISAKGFPPSVREIGEAVGLASSSTVHGHLQRLEEKGYVRRDPTKPRAMEVVGDERPGRPTWQVPVVGRVAAGMPILAQQHIEEFMPLPQGFVRGADPAELFFLEVQGDSMVLAGILDGDHILIRRQATARNGEIIVALIDGEATCKRYYKEQGRFRLKPENPYMDDMWFDEIDIVGKVVGVVRRMDN
ncbi:MAG TPA: transcriptional repressor LexA [Symbiobacteriaceae bacterium]|nr:transcriptional repressor LexA [Symbiobacteriaceae bacterium]